MRITPKKSYALVGTTIEDINNREMRQMHELNNRIKNVLDSHKDGSEKKEYISDDDLKLMHAVLSVFTKGFAESQKSAFDNWMDEQDKTSQTTELVKELEEANCEEGVNL